MNLLKIKDLNSYLLDTKLFLNKIVINYEK